MPKTITYINTDNVEENETSVINDLSKDFNTTKDYLSQKANLDSDLIQLANEYKSKLNELRNTRRNIQCTKYSKDNILCKIIELSAPPLYLKHQLFNYKAIVLYFMRSFRENSVIEYKMIESTIVDGYNPLDVKEKFFLNNEKMTIKTHMDTLLHLINIDKTKIRVEKVYEQMIYDTLEFGDYTQKLELFKSKIASIGWIKETINNPDFIYAKDSIIAKHLNFDIAFIRETGSGTKSQKYMYHLVGFKKIKNHSYTVITQFPIEKDRKIKEDSIVSELHKYVQCDKPIYVRNNKEIPLFSSELVKDVSSGVNRLMNHLGKSF